VKSSRRTTRTRAAVDEAVSPQESEIELIYRTGLFGYLPFPQFHRASCSRCTGSRWARLEPLETISTPQLSQ